METSIVPLEAAAALERNQPDAAVSVNFFMSGAQACLLNCGMNPQNKNSKTRRADSPKGDHSMPWLNTSAFRFEELAASAELGCRGCTFVKLLVGAAFQAFPDVEPKYSTLKWGSSPYTLEIIDRNGKARALQFFQLRGNQRKVVGMPQSNVLSGDTGSDISTNWMIRFVRECESLHSRCGSGRDTTMPTRLLNVAEIHDDDGNPGIRLEKTGGRRGTYACLSHCWGDPALMPSTTTTANLNSHLRLIPWQKLSPNFQDAVTLTRKLGVEYLWIDSFCIVQDSTEDWQEESGRMGGTYGNSYVTIASTSAPDSTGGCFSATRPDTCLRISEPGEPDMFVAVRDCDGAGKVDDGPAAFSRHSPLFLRAWVYQERMLSRRVVYCTRSEYRVGCREAQRCECSSPRLAPHFRYASAPRGNIARLRNASDLALSSGGGGLVQKDLDTMVLHNWFMVVEEYSRLALTRGSDKLPALSACAKFFSRNIQSEYLAGVWRKTLMEGLLWFVRGPLSRTRPRGDNWRAPSWSWASVDAPNGLGYLMPGPAFSDFFCDRIEAAECRPLGCDPTGQVSSGFIRLTVSLGRAFWRVRCRGCDRNHASRSKNGLPRADYKLHTADLAATPKKDWAPCRFDEAGLELMGGDCAFHADALVEDPDAHGFKRCLEKGSCRIAPLHLLHVPRRDNRQSWRGAKGCDASAFLALAKVDSREATFERIGLATISHRTPQQREAWFREVWSQIASPEQTITLV